MHSETGSLSTSPEIKKPKPTCGWYGHSYADGPQSKSRIHDLKVSQGKKLKFLWETSESPTSKSKTWNPKAHLLDVKSSPCGWPLRMYKIIITSDSCLTSKLPKSKQIKPTESAIMWQMNTNDTTVCNYIKCFFLLTWFIVDVEHHPSVNPSECLQITYSEFKDGTS